VTEANFEKIWSSKTVDWRRKWLKERGYSEVCSYYPKASTMPPIILGGWIEWCRNSATLKEGLRYLEEFLESEEMGTLDRQGQDLIFAVKETFLMVVGE